MKKLFLLGLIGLFLVGCATMFEDVRISEAEKQGRFYIGMTKDEVIQIIGRQPNCIMDACKTENTNNGIYKIWVINGGGMGGNFARTYIFKFKDDKLDTWGWE